MKDKIIYLHIGLHKTATTTIQSGLRLNSQRLIDDGYYYPNSGILGDAHHNLVWEIASGDILPWDSIPAHTRFILEYGGFDALNVELKSAPVEKIIISSEAFENLSLKRIHGLKEKLSEYEVRIIVYLRNQTDYYQSAWAQHIKFGLTNDEFSFWIEKILNSSPEFLSCFGDYKSLLDNWSSVFGRQNIILRLYDAQHIDGNIFFDFLESCGIHTYHDYSLPKNQNVSPGIKSLELMRLANTVFRLDSPWPAYFYSSLINYSHEKSWDTEPLSIVTAQDEEKINNFFNESNKSIALSYFGKAKLFDSRSMRKYSQFDIHQIDQVDLLRILTSTFVGFIETREEELNKYHKHIIADIERQLEETNINLIQSEQMFQRNKSELEQTKSELEQTRSELEQTRSELDLIEQKSAELAVEIDLLREGRFFRFINRFRKYSLHSLINPDNLRLLDDSYLFQNLNGFLLQPSKNLQTSDYLSYKVTFHQAGLCGVWIAPMFYVPLRTGIIGVEVVSPNNTIAVQMVMNVNDLRFDIPAHFTFTPISNTINGAWEIRVFTRDVDMPLRIFEWKKYSFGGLGNLHTRAFMGFDFE